MKFLSTLLVALLLVGCSSLGRFTDVTNLIDYSNHKSVKVLEIPPDLDSPIFDKTYVTAASDTMDTARSVGLDQVPLVDKTMGPPPASSVQIVKKGGSVMLQLEDDVALAWKRTNDALKIMGMTIAKADQSAGLIAARDRSLVSDPLSPIGRFLNESIGKVNEGIEYQFRVSGDDKSTTIEIADKLGKSLSEADARVVLARLRKEYTS